MSTRFVMVCVAALLGAAGFAGAEPDIRYGEWEFTTTFQIPMMPAPMTTTNRQCLTKETMQPEPPPDQRCSKQEIKVEGNTVRWEMECTTEGGTSRGVGEMVYAGDTAEGEMRFTVDVNGQPMTMEYDMKGRRIGDCS